MMKRILFLFVVALALVSCAPNPKDVAKAEVMRTQSQQEALDATRAREQQIKLDEIEIQNAQREQEVKDAALVNQKHAMEMATYWSGIAITVSLVLVILAVGASGSIAIYGGGRAFARAAMVKANLIYLDKSTGTFPQLLEYIGKGRYSLTDLNDHSTLYLDTNNEADRMAVRGAISIRHALVMSNAAKASKDASGVAMVQPLIIDAQMEEQ